MGYPVKNLRTTNHIPLNHFQLDYQGIPLFSIFRIQLQKRKDYEDPGNPKQSCRRLFQMPGPMTQGLYTLKQ